MKGSSRLRRRRARSCASGTACPSASNDNPVSRRSASDAAAGVVTVGNCSCGPVTIGHVTAPPGGPSQSAGVLVLAATPIGQAADAPPRLVAELAGADLIA